MAAIPWKLHSAHTRKKKLIDQTYHIPNQRGILLVIVGDTIQLEYGLVYTKRVVPCFLRSYASVRLNEVVAAATFLEPIHIKFHNSLFTSPTRFDHQVDNELVLRRIGTEGLPRGEEEVPRLTNMKVYLYTPLYHHSSVLYQHSNKRSHHKTHRHTWNFHRSERVAPSP